MREAKDIPSIIRKLGTAPGAGLYLALAAGLVSGFAIFLNSYAVKEFSSPSAFSTLKNTVVGLVLLSLLLPRAGSLKKTVHRDQLPVLALIAIVGGSIPFILFFEGLSKVDSGNAAFLHKTLFLWVGLLAFIFLKEGLGRGQLMGLAVLFLAQLLIGGPGGLTASSGTLMVFAAAILWSVEAVLVRKTLQTLDSQVAATARMALGAAILMAYLAASGGLGAALDLSWTEIAWLLGTAAVLLAYVTAWYAALQRAPATAVTCVLAIGAPITAALNVVAGRGLPEAEQLLGFGLVLAAAAAFLWSFEQAGLSHERSGMSRAAEA